MLKSKNFGLYTVRLHFFIRTRGSFCSKFKNKLRAIQPRQKNKVSNFQLK